jgi:putative flippase GtrA
MKKIIRKIIGWRFFRYCFCGGISALTDMSIFFALNELLKIHYLIALVCSFTVAVFVNYSLQRKITFKSTYAKKHFQFVAFVGIELGGLLISGISLTALVELAGLWPTLARFLSIFITLTYNYTLNRKITFNLMK